MDLHELPHHVFPMGCTGTSEGPSVQNDCGKSHHLSLIPWDGHLVHQDTCYQAPAQTLQQASTFGNSDDATARRWTIPLASTCVGLEAVAPSLWPEAHPEDTSRILGTSVPAKAWQGRQSTALAPRSPSHLQAAQTSLFMLLEKGSRGTESKAALGKAWQSSLQLKSLLVNKSFNPGFGSSSRAPAGITWGSYRCALGSWTCSVVLSGADYCSPTDKPASVQSWQML